MSTLGKLASDRMIYLKVFCTVNENFELIFLSIGYIKQNKQMVEQKVQ